MENLELKLHTYIVNHTLNLINPKIYHEFQIKHYITDFSFEEFGLRFDKKIHMWITGGIINSSNYKLYFV